MIKKIFNIGLLLLAITGINFNSWASIIPVTDFVKRPEISSLKISPSGKYFAAVVTVKDKRTLAILDRTTMKITTIFDFGGDKDVGSYGWLNDERVYASMQIKLGPLDSARPTGYMFAGNADGSGKRQLLPAPSKPGKGAERAQRSSIVSYLPKEPNHILISLGSKRPIVYKLNINNGRRSKITTSPVNNGNFGVDHDGQVRLAIGSKDWEEVFFYHRASNKDSWELIDSHKDSEGDFSPIGFTADGSGIYMNISGGDKPRGIYLYNPTTKSMTMHHSLTGDTDVESYIYDDNFITPQLIGLVRQPGQYEKEFFEPNSRAAQVNKALNGAFSGKNITVINYTKDKSLALLGVSSEKQPGSYYLLDTKSFKISFLMAATPWFKEENMATMTPISFAARDGLKIRGLLTLPNEKKTDLPMVVYIHGGPYGVKDNLGYEPTTQLLANRGYAVLQVNYRGSGGRGKDFQYDYYRQMGAEMQDDITDATLWAIKEGIANKERICIYGASYGGYASMMAVVKEPDLYKCAIPYAGVYDIAIQKDKSDTRQTESGRKFLKDAWNAYDDKFVKERSPLFHLDKLKAALFIVHGDADKRCPIEQYEALADGLNDINYPFESMVKLYEPHGFYKRENVEELYNRMLTFLDKHIGH